MTPLFADTSFYLAVLSPKDLHHARAVELGRDPRPHVTTECVIWELGNALCVGRDRDLFVSFVAALRADPATTIISADNTLLTRAIELFGQRPDKEWSLTDCASMTVMHDRGLTNVLTADRHFTQAGFNALLR